MVVVSNDSLNKLWFPPPPKNTLNYSFKAPLRFAVMGT